MKIYILLVSLFLSQISFAGIITIMPKEQETQYKSLIPPIYDDELNNILSDTNTMWYDSASIVPSYQDSMGDPKGNRPNTLDKSLIDLAVPGGHARIFAFKGRFNFPFGTGGADDSQNFDKINFWSLPKNGNSFHPVVYWKMSHARWRWLFPVGTVFGEVMLIKLPDNSQRVFEIRTRTKTVEHWDNKVFRPFLTPFDLMWAIRIKKPDWFSDTSLRLVMESLEAEGNAVSRVLQTVSFPGTFDKVTGKLDYMPDFGDTELVKDLLLTTGLKKVEDSYWRDYDGLKTYAPSTKGLGIVPKMYDGGLLPVSNDSCNRCHLDAGRSIRDFHDELMLYGELWGEDQIFSWHPFETSMFVDGNGNVVNFNNDNRRLRSTFSPVVVPLNRAIHPESIYKELPKSWIYRPVLKFKKEF